MRREKVRGGRKRKGEKVCRGKNVLGTEEKECRKRGAPDKRGRSENKPAVARKGAPEERAWGE